MVIEESGCGKMWQVSQVAPSEATYLKEYQEDTNLKKDSAI